MEEAPGRGGRKNFHSAQIYDSVLVFAYYVTVLQKPDRTQLQKAVYDIFMGSFDVLGKIFDVNHKWQMNLMAKIFKLAAQKGETEKRLFPAAFHMEGYSFDKEAGTVRYYFGQCPNAEFAKRYGLEDVLPLMCNCDHLALGKVGASLIRCSTCVTSDVCDYCIVGSHSELAKKYELITGENGLWLTKMKEE